jgi:hypothetical protein
LNVSIRRRFSGEFGGTADAEGESSQPMAVTMLWPDNLDESGASIRMRRGGRVSS